LATRKGGKTSLQTREKVQILKGEGSKIPSYFGVRNQEEKTARKTGTAAERNVG